MTDANSTESAVMLLANIGQWIGRVVLFFLGLPVAAAVAGFWVHLYFGGMVPTPLSIHPMPFVTIAAFIVQFSSLPAIFVMLFFSDNGKPLPFVIGGAITGFLGTMVFFSLSNLSMTVYMSLVGAFSGYVFWAIAICIGYKLWGKSKFLSLFNDVLSTPDP